MTEQLTLRQATELVSFMKRPGGNWKVLTVHGDVHGDVHGGVHGDVFGYVDGDVHGDVLGDVRGDVRGRISGRRWESVETPQEKLERLILESGDQELIEAFNQLHQNN
jgi:hypothetical protein